MDERLYVGVDLGGTKIAAAVTDCEGKILSLEKTETGPGSDAGIVADRIAQTVKRVIAVSGAPADRIAAVGLCSPGPLDLSEGIAVDIATLGWKDVPIRKLVSDRCGLPVVLERDCNAAAYGEMRAGAARGANDFIYVTVSTGVGCGIITGGNILHGKHDSAGEFGHICVDENGRKCACGCIGCLQEYSSGTAIAKAYMEHLSSKGINTSADCIDAEKAALAGDEYTAGIWRAAGRKLGLGLSVLVQLFDPEMIVLGGGVTKALKLFEEDMMDSMKAHTYPHLYEDLKIVRAGSGDNAGVVGAALIASEKYK